MELRSLGKSSLKITPLGLGCWQFAQGSGFSQLFWKAVPTNAMDDIVRAALDGGINWFDTAEAYGGGLSEQALSAALQRAGKKPGDVIVATKWLPFGRTAASIEKTLPERERRLSPFPVDLLQIHMPSSFSSFEKQAAALARLLKEKRVKAVGVSNFSADQMRRVHKVLSGEGLVLASNQVLYALNQRAIESDGILDTAKELGVTIIAYSPLSQGLLSGRFHDDPSLRAKVPFARRMRMLSPAALKKTEPLIRALQQIGAKHQASASQVALSWLVTFHGETVVAIPGATKASQAAEIARTLSLTLTKDELGQLDSLSHGMS